MVKVQLLRDLCHFRVEKFISVQNPSAHFTFNISANQGLEPMLFQTVKTHHQDNRFLDEG